MRATVVGADGFVGSWLTRHLVESDDQVTALPGPLAGGPDVRDEPTILTAIRGSQPHVVFYLAGRSQRGQREEIADAVAVNVTGAMNVLAACSQQSPRVTLVHMGSAHQYDTDAPMPLREDSPLGPRSVYGATKAAAERALLTMGPALGVDVIAIRGFNLVGPGQRPPFVLPALGTQVLAAANGEADLIHAGGSLDVSRDFTDIRDGVRALRAVAVRGVPGEAYNLCSGIAARLSEILSDLFTLAGTRPVPVDALKPAANDEPSTVAGDNTKLRTATGWQPLIGFRTTLSDILADLSGASESATSSAGR